MTRRLDNDEIQKLERSAEIDKQLFGNQGSLTLINESGVYNAIFGSKKASSEKKQVFLESFYKFLGKEQPVFIQTRQEIEFGDSLTKILEPFNYEIISQYQVDTYRIDFYIKDLNLAIEYDEEHHKNQINDDAKRQKYISEKLGCDFIRLSNKESHLYNCGLVMKYIFNMKRVAV